MPLFLLLFLIFTLKPVLSEITCSRSLILGSLERVILLPFFLKILTKFSVCLTDNFFSMILLATNTAFSKPTRILAWPEVIFFLQHIL